MLRPSRFLAACAFLIGILLGASVCGAGSGPPPGAAAPPQDIRSSLALGP